MRYKGLIKDLNHIVISDPSYKDAVWCRYEKDNLNEKDWNVDLQVYSVKTKFEDYDIRGTEFYLLLQKDKRDCKIDEEGSIRYLSDIEIKDYTIGMDTACIALGINADAKEIIDSRDEWQPDCAIRTGTDGTFGEVTEGIRNRNLCFLLVTGYIEEEFCDEKEMFQYLASHFQIEKLTEFNDKSKVEDKENQL